MFNKQLLLNQTDRLEYVGVYNVTVDRLIAGSLEMIGYSWLDQFGSYAAYEDAPQLLSFYTQYYNGIATTFISGQSYYNFKDMIILRGDTPYIIQYDGENNYIDASVFGHQDLNTTVIVALFSYN